MAKRTKTLHFSFGTGLGGEQENGVESSQPPSKVKLHIFVERGHVADSSQKVKLRKGREDMEEKAERLALFFKTTWNFPGSVPLVRKASCSESTIQGNAPQAGDVAMCPGKILPQHWNGIKTLY